MKKLIVKALELLNLSYQEEDLIIALVHLVIIVILSFIVYWITRKIVLTKVHSFAERTHTKWDDLLIQERFFKKLAGLLPITIVLYSVNSILKYYQNVVPILHSVVEAILAIAFLRVIISFLNALHKMLETKERYKDKPLQSYFQLAKILIYTLFAILVFSVLTGKTPLFFITAMGTMSAILLLIFKDTILGFIASIQLSANDMVRIGDWITMSKYGADGTVIEINLATIKVRNFDLTITTIPTYSLISDSFKNWRGMEESKGRRIKRAINVKISTIKFCDTALLEELKKIKLLTSYIETKQEEIKQYNQERGLDNTEVPNGRSLTNVGIFRKYIEFYLRENNNINQELTCMVRQLAPNEKGLPIEIYAFSKRKEWVIYESIMADIFDHLLSVVPAFQLEVFQYPTGTDISHLITSSKVK